MSRLRNEIRKIELLCWSTSKDRYTEKIDQYLKAYPHINNPASKDLLRQAVKQWYRIEEAEEMLKKCENNTQKNRLMIRIEKMTRIWMSMITNLGLSFTKQQYISKRKTRVMPPLDRLKNLTKEGKKLE